jgi:arginase
MTASLVALRFRTSDRTAAAVRGVDELAPLLGERLGRDARAIGTPGEPRDASWDDDLRDSRGCLLEAGGQVDDALEAGRVPVLLAGECSIALTTLPTVLRQRPDAVILWLGARGSFDTPASRTGTLPASSASSTDRVVLAGVRDLGDEERAALERSDVTVIGASPIETLVAVKNALYGAPVYVHLELDVLDPEAFPAREPAPDGLSPDKLLDLLEAVIADCELIGIEVTGFEAPADDEERHAAAETVMRVLEPLLETIPEGANVHG